MTWILKEAILWDSLNAFDDKESEQYKLGGCEPQLRKEGLAHGPCRSTSHYMVKEGVLRVGLNAISIYEGVKVP